MLLRVTSCSTFAPSPSAKPLSRSRATIMKSLSGASYCSGCWLYICNESMKLINTWGISQIRFIPKQAQMWTDHGLSEVLLDQRDTALINRLTIGQKAALQSCGHWRQTLQQQVHSLKATVHTKITINVQLRHAMHRWLSSFSRTLKA